MKIKHAPALAAVIALTIGASGCTHIKNMFDKDDTPATESSAPASETTAPTDGSMAPAPGATP